MFQQDKLDKNKANKISVIRFAWMKPSPKGYPKNKTSNVGPVSWVLKQTDQAC